MDNSTVIHTTSGFYEIYGNGFQKIEPELLKLYFVFKKAQLVGQIIDEVKSDMEFCTLRLSNGDFITHHVDTSYLILDLYKDVVNDKEYLDYFNNTMQPLSDTKSYAKI